MNMYLKAKRYNKHRPSRLNAKSDYGIGKGSAEMPPQPLMEDTL